MRSSFLAGPRRVRHERARCLSRSWATVTLAFVSLLSTSPAIASIDFAVPFHSYDVVAFPTSVAVGDLNGDGDLDVVVTNGGSSPLVSVLLGNGNGTLGVKTDLSVALISLSSVAIEDLNADGKLDLAVAGAGNQRVSVLLGNGDGSFGSQTVYVTPSLPRSVAIGDLNADGKPDLVTANASAPGSVSVLLGNGDGTFGPRTDFATGGGPSSVAIGDLNGDGKPDLAVANPGVVPQTVFRAARQRQRHVRPQD